jgi:hypothetical protein
MYLIAQRLGWVLERLAVTRHKAKEEGLLCMVGVVIKIKGTTYVAS